MNAAPPGDYSEKRKAPTSTKTEGAFQNTKPPAHSRPAGDWEQANSEEWKRWRATLRAIQHADIHPPVLRLLLLDMAIHANPKTGLIWPSVTTMARECSLSTAHTKRLLRTAKSAGLIVVAQATLGGNRADTVHYRIDTEKVARGFMGEPGSPMNPVHKSTLRGFIHDPSPGSSVSYKEDKKTVEENPPGGGVSPGSGFAGPVGVDSALWGRLIEKPWFKLTGAQLHDLVAEGNELHAQSADINALVKMMLAKKWQDWPRVGDAVQVRGSRLGASDADWGIPA